MRKIIPPFIFLAFVILLCISLMPSATAVTGGSISGKIYFNTGNQNIPAGTNVSLVDGYNESIYIPGFNTTPDQNGFYQFVNVSHGFYKVYAWSPYYTEGYSEGLNITSNDTYTRDVVIMALPYYANMTASTRSVRYNERADVTVAVSDFWGRPVGQGWQILLRTTVGLMEPDSALTDKDGKVYSSIAWVDSSEPANITAFAIATNGSSYGLEENITVVAPTPTAVPSVTPTVNATASPTASPNATVVASATPTPLPSASATPKPTPGFVLIAVLVAMGIALAFRKYK